MSESGLAQVHDAVVLEGRSAVTAAPRPIHTPPALAGTDSTGDRVVPAARLRERHATRVLTNNSAYDPAVVLAGTGPDRKVDPAGCGGVRTASRACLDPVRRRSDTARGVHMVGARVGELIDEFQVVARRKFSDGAPVTGLPLPEAGRGVRRGRSRIVSNRWTPGPEHTTGPTGHAGLSGASTAVVRHSSCRCVP